MDHLQESISVSLAQGQLVWFLISVESFANVQTNQITHQIHLGHSYKIRQSALTESFTQKLK